MSTSSPSPTVVQQLSRELEPTRLVSSIAAGLLTGSLSVILAITFATLAFAGRLDNYVGFAIGLTLAGSAAAISIVALTSSYPGAIAPIQDSPAAILALMVAALVEQLDGSPERVMFVTAVAAILLTTVLTGVAMFAIGAARLGRLVRFIPYPVIGGFLAGTGFLLFTGGLHAMTGTHLTAETLGSLFEPVMLARWLPGLVLAVVIMILSRRIQHPLLLPVTMIVAVALFYVILQLNGITMDEAAAQGLVVGPLPEGGIWQMPSPAELLAVDWGLIFGQATQIATVILLSAVPLLLNSSGIELVVQKDMDLNQELRATGLANIVGGLLGGFPSYQALSITLLGHWMRANSRLVGLVAGGVALATLLFGGQLLSILPNALLGGFLMFLGLSLLTEWVVDSARRLPLPEYLIIVIILFVIAARGYLDGVAVGIVAAVILFLIQFSRQSVIKHSFSNDTFRSTVLRYSEEEAILKAHGAETLILQLQGYIFFGTANSVFEAIKARTSDSTLPKFRHALLDFRRVTALDTSALLSFTRMKQNAAANGFTLVLTHVAPHLEKQFESLLDTNAGDAVVRRFADIDRGLEWCENNTLSRFAIAIGADGHKVEGLLSRAMSAEIASIVIRYLKRVDVAKGTVLVQQGDTSNELYFIESGTLSVQLELANGQAMRVRTAKAGTVLGEIGFCLRRNRTATIIADENSTVFAMTPDGLDRMTDEAPSAAAATHQYLAGILAERLSESTSLLRNALD